MNGKTTVVWVSRHSILKVQKEVLIEKLGTDIEIVKMPNTYKNAGVIIQELNKLGADYAVVVLPLSVIRHLLNTPERNGIVFLTADMQPTLGTYNPDSDVLIDEQIGMKRHVRFTGYKVLKAIEIVSEPLQTIVKVPS